MTPALAGAEADCSIGRFQNPDGSTDLTGYLQCSSPGLSETTVAPGGTITFSGGGFASDSDVKITLFSDPVDLGSTTADASGNFSVEVAIPDGTPAGEHHLEASGLDPDGNPLVVSLSVTVTDSGTTPVAAVTPSGALPFTGSDVARTLSIGLAAVVVGGAAVWGARRGRRNVEA